MEENKQFNIGFGALVPPISKQLKEQGFKFDTEKVKHFEKLRESITYLQFSDMLNDKAREKAIKKLFTQVRQHVMKKNKLKLVQKN
jgi:hypothetical protein